MDRRRHREASTLGRGTRLRVSAAFCAAALVLCGTTGCMRQHAAPESRSSPTRPAGSPTPASSERCLKSQRAELPRLIRGWWASGDNVAAGSRRAASNVWHLGVEEYLHDANAAGCPPVPREALALLATDPLAGKGVVLPLPRLDTADVREIQAALLSLVHTLGASSDVRHMAQAPLTCRELERAAPVTYQVQRKHDGPGDRLSLVVHVHNTTSRRLVGSTWGQLHVSEVLPGTPPNLDWGASGADDLWVKPGASVDHTAYGVNWDHLSIPTSATITKLRVGAYLSYGYTYVNGENEPLSCHMHVTPR